MESIWLNVGEASADGYGALVCEYIKSRAPDVECLGMGGPQMRAAGLSCVVRSEDLSVMGITEVASALPRIFGMLRRIKSFLRRKRPKAVFLFDCPDFNFRVARMAAKLDIPVYYCIAPQAWAWRQGRVKFLRKYVRELLCIFPFEEEFFCSHGVNARYIGHPLLQVLPGKIACPNEEKKRLAVLPGSRKMELTTLIPAFSAACRKLVQVFPELDLQIIRAPGVREDSIRNLWPEDVPVRIYSPEERHERMQKSTAALAASGTVSMECALLGIPTVVAYRVSGLSYLLGRTLVDIPYISMPNLILGEEVFPEFLQGRARGDVLADALAARIVPGDMRRNVLDNLDRLCQRLGNRDAIGEIGRRALEQLEQDEGEKK